MKVQREGFWADVIKLFVREGYLQTSFNKRVKSYKYYCFIGVHNITGGSVKDILSGRFINELFLQT